MQERVFFGNDDQSCFFFDGDEDFDAFEDGIVQETEQEVESREVDQAFTVTGGGNSNQTVSKQGVANTGNAQNVIDVVDTGDFGGFDDGHDGFFDDREDCFFFDGVFICNDFKRYDSDFFDDGFEGTDLSLRRSVPRSS